jgi:hypothetical protein
MIKLFKYTFFIYFLFNVYSCREPFDYTQSDKNEKILVVDGTVTNDAGPYVIKLSQAVPFGKTNQVFVRNAKVYVTDDLNNKYDFTEKVVGQYFSDSASFRGEIGRVYTLFIQTAEGIKYKSNPCKIEEESKIDSIYGFNERFLLYAAGTNFNDEDVYANGLHVYADISYGSNQKISTRLDANLATEYRLIEWHFIYAPRYIITIDPNDSTHIIRTRGDGYVKLDSFEIITTSYSLQLLNILPILRTNSNYKVGSKIRKIPVEYVYGDVFNGFIDDSTTYSTGGNWIFILKAFTVSNETYNYYYNLSNQIDGKNSFFEPIPIQLKGNIKCTSDSTQSVFGLFQANSVVKKYISVTNNGGLFHWIKTDRIPAATRDSIPSSTFQMK